jgi:polar amino acid transport system substrate-binding protein
VNSTPRWTSVVLVALLAAACTLEGSPARAPTPTPDEILAHAPAPSAAVSPRLPVVPSEQLLFSGSLLICSDLPYPPQEFFDERGRPIGSDIELGEEIARRLGLEARIVNSVFDTIIDAVIGGKCDIVISAQSITADRTARVDMIPYFQAGMTFVRRRGSPAAIHTELDLCGLRVAVQSGTVQVQLVTGSGDYLGGGLAATCAEHDKAPIRMHQFEKDDEALAALKGDRVDVYFVDSPAAGYHVMQDPQTLALTGLTLEVAVQGISVPKDRSGLRDAISAALVSMMDDGTYASILARYGVQDGSVARAARRP